MRETNNLKALHECDRARKVLFCLAFRFYAPEGNFILFQYKPVKFPSDTTLYYSSKHYVFLLETDHLPVFNTEVLKTWYKN
jgi:hypothetical protein